MGNSNLTPDAYAAFARLSDDEIARACEVQTFHAHGPGGQGVNTADSAVRMRHVPTGIVVVSRESRSQLRNRALCVAKLRAIFEPRAAALACARATGQELADILDRGRAVETCIRAGRDRTKADWEFHAAIVRATHNEFMTRLLPLIGQAVGTAVASGGHGARLAEDTLRDHALLMEFLEKRDGAGAEHAMAIHIRHAMGEMGLEGGAAG